MKVYLVTEVDFPNGMAATNRVKCLAKAILSTGVECEVIVTRRTEFSGSDKGNNLGRGLAEGIPFQYVSGHTVRSSHFLQRRWDDFADETRTLRYLRKNLKSDDIVLGYMNLNMLLIYRIIKLTHRCHARYFRDLCEFPFINLPDHGRNDQKRKWIERIHFPLYDGVLPISDTLSDYAKQHVTPQCVIQKIPILVDFERYELPDHNDLAEKPYLFHSGTLSEKKDGFLGMTEAFGKAVNENHLDAQFVSTGSLEKVTDKERYKQLIQQYHLEDKVCFTGYLTEDQLRDRLSKAALVVVNKHDTTQNRYCFSTKLGEYMAAGKPLIITRIGEAMNWLDDQEDALIVEEGDLQQMADAITLLLNHPEERKRIGSNAREKCRRCFDYKVYGPTLIDAFLCNTKE